MFDRVSVSFNRGQKSLYIFTACTIARHVEIGDHAHHRRATINTFYFSLEDQCLSLISKAYQKHMHASFKALRKACIYPILALPMIGFSAYLYSAFFLRSSLIIVTLEIPVEINFFY